jgi:hypothetical protein
VNIQNCGCYLTLIIIIITVITIIIITFVVAIGNKRMKTFWNNFSLSTQKHAHWRLYYNTELIKITLEKEQTQKDKCVDSAMLSETRGQLQTQT